MSVEGLARSITSHGDRVLESTGSLDEVVDVCTSALRPHTLRMRENARLATRLDRVALGDVSVNRLVYGAEVTVAPAAPDEDNFLLVLPSAGRAEFRYGDSCTRVVTGSGAVVGPYRDFEFAIDASFDQVIVRLDRGRVESVAAALSGVDGAVEFDLAGAPGIGALAGLLTTAVALVSTPITTARPALIWQLEQVLVETLLLSQPNSHLTSAGRHAAVPSRRLRSALDFLVDHLDEPFSIAAVAAHCGVSVRSLQEAFRRELDTTPSHWLRARRLEQAHVLLLRAEPGTTTVTEVACAVGMFHLGDFADHFRARFGLTPSQVLAGRPAPSARTR
jgi:AraC-like DNA-binding protein